MKSPTILIDSGAFTARKKGIIIDIDEYISYIKKNDYYVDYFFNLDVIGDGKASYKNWVYLRSKGIDTIPVYHIGSDIKYLQKYLKQTDYVAVGAIASLASDKRFKGLDRVFKEYFTDVKGLPVVKVHGLGITALDMIRRYNWFSVDSSSAGLASAMGKAYFPKMKRTNQGFAPDWTETIMLDVSNRRPVKTTTSFLGLPTALKQGYEELLEKYGFMIGPIGGVQIKTTRKEKGEFRDTGLFTLRDVEEHEEQSLSHDHMQRFLWSSFVWGKMIETLPRWNRPLFQESYVVAKENEQPTRVHLVPIPIDYMRALDGQFNVLYSYFYMTKQFEEVFKKWKGVE